MVADMLTKGLGRVASEKYHLKYGLGSKGSRHRNDANVSNWECDQGGVLKMLTVITCVHESIMLQNGFYCWMDPKIENKTQEKW